MATDIGSIESDSELFIFDGVVSESHSATSTVTKFPVEYGANIADSIIDQPIELVIDGVVTDRPISISIPNTFQGGESRSASAYEALLRLRSDHKLLVVRTGLMVYVDMIISAIDVMRGPESSSVLNARITLEQAIVTRPDVRQPESLSGDEAKQQATSRRNTGKNQVLPAPPDLSSPGQKLLNALGGLF